MPPTKRNHRQQSATKRKSTPFATSSKRSKINRRSSGCLLGKDSPVNRMPPISGGAQELPRLTSTEQDEALSKIPNVLDRNLQILLWELDCNYQLLQHQFQGVRELSGVVPDFPGPLNLKKRKGQTDDSYDNLLFDWVVDDVLRQVPPATEYDRGLILADVMGLGKTVQAVAACILRNAIALAQGAPKRPTIIVSPNEAVLVQWHECLIKAGVQNVYRFRTKKSKPIQGAIYVLCTRYDLMAEMRQVLFETHNSRKVPFSPLFPCPPKELMLVLKNQYESEKDPDIENQYIEKGSGITVSECVSEYMSLSSEDVKYHFETVILDEAHFMKSLKTYWGMAAGVMGLHAGRIIPMSGTPFNNNVQDMATLMTFIDPSTGSAGEKWWKENTKNGEAKAVVEAVKDWSDTYLLRRDKNVISAHLPPKIIKSKSVLPYPMELREYEKHEESFLGILSKFQTIEEGYMTPAQKRHAKFLKKIMMAAATCMRAALIHPVLPSGGRDLSIFFSPSRSSNPAILKAQERPNRCVCCTRTVTVKKKAKDAFLRGGLENLNDEDLQDEDEAQFIDDDVDAGDKGSGNMVPIPSNLCKLAGAGLRHFACTSCLEEMERFGVSCILCTDLFSRLKIGSGQAELLKMKKESGAKASTVDCVTDTMVPRDLFCKDTFGGFRASAKIQSILDHFAEIPSNEKVLLVSFTKGSLDLLEGIFYEMNVEVARFDGDNPHEERQWELERFKTEPSCRILLATVQTCGTGINLVEANHVVFVDRWFNPTVLEQCEDRCYRFGQTKKTNVTYHDVTMTSDDVMRQINLLKSDNATILLSADGTALTGAGKSFTEISGILGASVRAARFSRISHISSLDNIRAPLPPTSPSMLSAWGDPFMQQPASMLGAIAILLGYVTPSSLSNRRAPGTTSTATVAAATISPITAMQNSPEAHTAVETTSRATSQDFYVLPPVNATTTSSSTITRSNHNPVLNDSDDDSDDTRFQPVVFTPRTSLQTPATKAAPPKGAAQVTHASDEKSNKRTAAEAFLGGDDLDEDDSSFMEPVALTNRTDN